MSRNKLINVALLASVAINLVFVGGIAYRAANMPEFGPRPFPPNVGWIIRDLDEDRRAELEPTMQQSYDEIRPIRREMMQAQRRVNELMAAATLDAAALNQAFAELRAAGERYQALSHQQTLTILEQLTEEERRVAMEFLQRRGPRDGFRGREGGRDFGPRFAPDGMRGPGGRPPPEQPVPAQ